MSTNNILIVLMTMVMIKQEFRSADPPPFIHQNKKKKWSRIIFGLILKTFLFMIGVVKMCSVSGMTWTGNLFVV